MPNNLKLISGRVAVTSAANVAADRYQYLDLSSAEPNLGTGNTGDVLIYNSSFPGGRKWIPQGEIRGSIGESAYDEANTASANTLYLAGVNITQNTRLDIIEGVNLWQNTEIGHANTKAQAAFDKANTAITTAGGTITGSLNVSQDLAVTGNLTVLGTTTTINTASFVVTDSLIVLATGNYTSDLLDIGISGHYNDGTNAHTGFIRDPGTKEWYVFEGYTPEVTGNNNININDASFAKANVNADYFKGNVIATTVNINGRDQASVDATQNTNITNISSLAQAAFNRANSAARATASNTTPTGNTVGDLWLSLTDETLYMYSYDGTSNNWIDISGPILISTNIVVQYTITSNVV
jgi:hypothetical protein